MMSYLGMYFFTKLDDLQYFLGCAGSITLFLVAASYIILIVVVAGITDDMQDLPATYKKLVKKSHLNTLLVISILLIILKVLLPTTKQAAFIYIAPQIIENGEVKDTVKNIPELTKLGTEDLKELLKEKIERQN